MKFSIVTPTHMRPDTISRTVDSVLRQTYTDWEMIVVNDSPDDASYTSFEKTISDTRIIYLKNTQNAGVNFSRNRALDNISKDSDWIIFLDDDDYLAPDAIATFRDLIQAHPANKWFIANIAYTDGRPLTSIPKSDTKYSFARDYLILRRCTGDATHCIETKLIANIRFSKFIKQAEEWLFSYQVGLKSKIFYHNHNVTITDGYSETSGLNLRKRTRSEKIETFIKLIHEGAQLHLLYHPTYLIFMFMQLVRLCFKS